jgi:hypothetical protein
MNNIFNKIITENLPMSRRFFAFRYRKPPGYQTDLDQNRTNPWHIIIKTTSTENTARILKAIRKREKNNR